MELHIKGPYDPSNPVQVEFTEPSMVKRSFQAECDINTIMLKYEKTGLLEHVRSHQGHYGDFSELPDYQTAMNTVARAEQSFESLPAKLRKRFSNDPGEFLAFVQDPDNHDEMVKLGLVPSPPKKDQSPGPATKEAAVEAAPAIDGPPAVDLSKAAPAAS